jgi:hypothetical protein
LRRRTFFLAFKRVPNGNALFLEVGNRALHQFFTMLPLIGAQVEANVFGEVKDGMTISFKKISGALQYWLLLDITRPISCSLDSTFKVWIFFAMRRTW